MNDRKRRTWAQEVSVKPSDDQVELTPPSGEQERYLKELEQAANNYDPSVIVGGPRCTSS